MTTRIPPEYTGRFGCAELHGVIFQHKSDRGGPAATVAVQIPEGEQHLNTALSQAQALRARVFFLCDTAAQAKRVRRRAKRRLPDHRVVALERAAAGAWSLS
jgi:hypothetical protein